MILPGNDTNTLPKITYDELAGNIKISGRSISPEVGEYFKDFVPYFKEYVLNQPSDLQIDIDLEYFNTQTAKMLVEFFDVVKQIQNKKFKIEINWFVEDDDEDMFESGFDYQTITGLEFNIIEKPGKA